MPELPEAERNRALCESALVGKKILHITFIGRPTQEADGTPVAEAHGNVVHPSQQKLWEDQLVGKTLHAVHRRAKVIYWEFLEKNVAKPLFSFGMSGSFHLEGGTALNYQNFQIDDVTFPPRHTRIMFEFEDGIKIAYICIRGFANVHLFDDPLVELPIRDYAPDPIHEMPNQSNFHASVIRFRKGIKAVLLGQKRQNGVVCGLGNWLCDDVLYAAGIDPDVNASMLREDQTFRLHSSIVNIITTAVRCNADESKFPSHWLFHRRWNKNPKKEDLKTLDGETISIKRSAGRATFYVKAALIKKGSKAMSSSSSTTSSTTTSSSTTSKRTKKKKTRVSLHTKMAARSAPSARTTRTSKRQRVTKATSAIIAVPRKRRSARQNDILSSKKKMKK
jgi:formamidopyrimidine-DNA glycosylase